MKKKIPIVLVLAFIIGLIPGVTSAKQVACVGDSITYGYGISNPASNSYPAQLAMILQRFDSEWETQNFGHSGATLLRNKSASYVTQNAYSRALASEPDVVVIMLGTNDSARATRSEIEQRFVPDYLALIDAFAQLPSQPKIFVCYPPPIFGGGYGSDSTIRDVIIPLIQQLPTHRTVEVIDMYTPLGEFGHLFPDQLHPNAEGAGIIAEIVASAILGFRFIPDFNGDGKIDIEDLIILIEHWNQDEPLLDIAPPPVGDGVIDVQDLEILMSFWGQEPNDHTLTACWKMDESDGVTATDSARECDGMLHGEPLWQPEEGMIDGALAFDGIDDYVSTDPVLNPADGKFSVLAWIKGGIPGQAVLSQADGSNWLCFDSVEGCLITALTNPGRSSVGPLLSQANITDDNWHRIGFMWDGSYRHLYVDGAEVAEDTAPLPELESAEGGLYFGTGSTLAPGTFFSGLIDDVRIYNRVIHP